MLVHGITFDLWDTLYYDDSFSEQARYERRYHLIEMTFHQYAAAVNDQKLHDAWNKTSEMADRIWADEYRTIGVKERLWYLSSQLKISLADSITNQLVAAIEKVTLEIPPRPVSGVAELLKSLSQKYPLGLISDTGLTPGRLMREIMRKDGLLGFFKILTFSDEAGVAKPHHRIFAITLQAMKVVANEAVHIGNNESTDIKGAIDYGMYAIHLSKQDASLLKNNSRYYRMDSLQKLEKILESSSYKSGLADIKLV